jgi:hypothetical protein
MKSSMALLVWSLALVLLGADEIIVASNTVKLARVRGLVRHFPPLIEMARRFRAIVCGSGECTRVRLRRLPLSRHTG